MCSSHQLPIIKLATISILRNLKINYLKKTKDLLYPRMKALAELISFKNRKARVFGQWMGLAKRDNTTNSVGIKERSVRDELRSIGQVSV